MSKFPKQRRVRNPKVETAFDLFPRLPLEVRIQMWEHAAFERLLIINGNRRHGWWSPTPTPAVTRACRESRKHSSYCKHFLGARTHPERYIWMHPANDIIQISPRWMENLRAESADVTKLRIDISDCKFWTADTFFFEHGGNLETYPFIEDATFPALEQVDVVVAGELARWTNSFDDSWWDGSTGPFTRIVSCHTGEWLDKTNCNVYWDWLENKDRKEGQVFTFTRNVGEEVESCEERVRKITEFKGLPRTDLAYW